MNIIINAINTVFEWIFCAISSDFFANIISAFELIVAIIAIRVGGKKVSEWITEFRERRTEAAFGYYMNLVYFIKRMKPLIFSDDGQALKTLYRLSATPDIRKDVDSSSMALGKKLSNIASECLQYLSSNNNQIPPFENYVERREWKASLNTLVNYLNQFYLIDNDIHLPQLDDIDGITNYYGKLCDLFKYFEDTVEKVTDDIFRGSKSEDTEVSD